MIQFITKKNKAEKFVNEKKKKTEFVPESCAKTNKWMMLFCCLSLSKDTTWNMTFVCVDLKACVQMPQKWVQETDISLHKCLHHFRSLKHVCQHDRIPGNSVPPKLPHSDLPIMWVILYSYNGKGETLLWSVLPSFLTCRWRKRFCTPGPEWGHFSAREFQAQNRPTFSMVVEIG